MKFIFICSLLFFSFFSSGYACLHDVSEFSSLTVRRDCFKNMLNHWIEDAQTQLLTEYKRRLAISSAYGAEEQFRTHSVYGKRIDELIKYEGMLKLMFPVNATPINLTCSSGLDTAD